MNAEENVRPKGDGSGAKAKRPLQLAWVVALIGCLLRLLGDLSASSGERIAGNLIALFGLAAGLWFYLEPKIGNHRPPDKTE